MTAELCPEGPERREMDDGSFWERVARNLGANVDEIDPLEMLDNLETFTDLTPTPCNVCGSYQECGYDHEGRPMIHVQDDDDT